MPVSARASVSFRPWIAAAIALALMLSLAAVVAPAAATGEPDGTVVFVNPPDFLDADREGVETFVVAVSGDFHINATTLAGGVSGIDVTVELTAPDDPSLVIASETESTAPGPDSATASVITSLADVAPGFYDVHATARLLGPYGELLDTLGTDKIGPLPYFPVGELCDGESCEVSSGGTSVSVDVGDSDAVTTLGLLGATLPADACEGDYTPLPETVFFDIIVDDPTVTTARITVDLTRDARQTEQNNGISQYQFCYLGGVPFVPRDETEDVEASAVLYFPQFPKLEYGPALLPECSANGEVAPCVLDRRSRGGGAQFTFLVPTGDPMFR